ncbi:MAG TPA: hypothetical protein VMD59_02490, partial [Acidimicrobiales bacterium]|nr:hypothetical protein [Acidimicrobiales bacterium]
HFKEVIVVVEGSDTELRAFVAPGRELSGDLRVSFARVLLYREGTLLAELAGELGEAEIVPEAAALPRVLAP